MQNLPNALSDKLTIIITTSPIRSHPSTELLEHTMKTFGLVRGLLQCPKIIVCDGFILKPKVAKSNKRGFVDEDSARRYKLYIEALKSLLEVASKKSKLEHFQNCRLLELQDHHGFGWAVKRALDLVQTELIMVVQHDWAFINRISIDKVCEALLHYSEVKYVGMLTTGLEKHDKQVLAKFGFNIEPTEKFGPRLLPLLFWYDKTHICTTHYYKEFVLSWEACHNIQIKKGKFIEDILGQKMIADLKSEGFIAHQRYGTYVMFDGLPSIGHLHGRKYLTQNMRKECGWGERDYVHSRTEKDSV